MAQLTLEVNGRPYVVGCEDGQEGHLRDLAALINSHVLQVGREVGQLGETRLILMGALLLADELTDIRARLTKAEGESARLGAALAAAQDAAISALEGAADRIEAMAGGKEHAVG
jgi:cell division protein ZapA